MIIIGIIGSHGGVGVTHTAIGMATGLKKRCKVAVLNRSKNDSLYSLGKELDVIDSSSEGDYFTYKGVDYFLKDVGTPAFNKNYDVLIVDHGTELENDVCHEDFVFVVMSARPWSRGCDDVCELMFKLDSVIGLENIYGVVPFADKDVQKYYRNEFPETSFLFPDYEKNPLTDVSSDYRFILKASRGMRKQMKSFETQIENLERENENAGSRNAQLRESLRYTEDILKQKESEEKKKEAEYQATLNEHRMKLSEVSNSLKEKEESIASYTNLIREKEEETRRLEERLFVSTHDELTGLGNRRLFTEELKKMSESGEPYVIVCFDVNNLKQANDNHGHSKGDELLTTVSEVINDEFEALFRVGGDEFNAIVPYNEFFEEKLQNIDNLLCEVTKMKRDGIIYEVAYGYATSTECNEEEILDLADKRMYENKALKKANHKDIPEDISFEEDFL